MSERYDTQAQIQELLEIREAKRRRFGVLQVQAATYGYETPAHIKTELSDLEGELTRINAKLAELERAKRKAELQQLEAVPSVESLTPVTIVPQTINEHLIALAAQFENFKVEARREFRAVQVAILKESEQRTQDHETTRDMIKEEQDERVEWQESEKVERERRQAVLSRWLFALGFGILLLFVLFVLYATNQYFRDLYSSVGR